MTTTVVPITLVLGSGAVSKGRKAAGRPRRDRWGGRTIGERDRIILSYQWLVRAVALGFRGRGLDYDDLVSEGQFGLLRAAELFDPSYGKPLVAYAARWIRRSIGYGIAARGAMVRVPHGARGLASRFRRGECSGNGMTGEPEMKRFLRDCPRHHRLSTLQAGLAACRLRRAYVSDVGRVDRASGFQGDCDKALGRVDDREWTETALAKLPEREAAIVRARFGLSDVGSGQALREVGRRFGIGPERARQLSDRAIGRLRDWSNADHERRDSSERRRAVF